MSIPYCILLVLMLTGWLDIHFVMRITFWCMLTILFDTFIVCLRFKLSCDGFYMQFDSLNGEQHEETRFSSILGYMSYWYHSKPVSFILLILNASWDVCDWRRSGSPVFIGQISEKMAAKVLWLLKLECL